MNKRIIKKIIISALAICVVATGCAIPMASKKAKSEPVQENVEVVTEAPVEKLVETTTEITTEAKTNPGIAKEITKKKSTYKAKTDVKTQKATGDKKKDEDKGSDKVIDDSLSENNKVPDKDKIEEHEGSNKPTPPKPVKPEKPINPSNPNIDPDDIKTNYWEAKNIDYKFANTSNAVGWQQYGDNVYYLNNHHQPLKGMQRIGGSEKRNYYFNEYGAKASLVGIDVSQHNGSINWNKVKNDGIDYAIIRVGFRGYGTLSPNKPVMIDEKVEQNLAGAKAAGIPVGIYFYSQAINVNEALEEAGACVKYAQKYNVKLPIYFDTEFACGDRSGRADKLSKAKRTEIAVAFCEAVKNAGYTPGVYASKFFYYDNLDFSQLKDYEIWMAHYTTGKTDFKYNYSKWQYTSSGNVSGISGRTDMNISLYDYVHRTNMKYNGKDTLLLNNNDFRLYLATDLAVTNLKNNHTEANATKAKQLIESIKDKQVKDAFLYSYNKIV